MTNSRNKGAAFERQIAKELHAFLGISFERDLDQYRKCDRGDLIPDDEDFPFLIECKKTARVITTCDPAWWAQASKAASAARKLPVVIWATDRRAIRCTVRINDAVRAISGVDFGAEPHLIELPLDGFAYLCREAMS